MIKISSRKRLFAVVLLTLFLFSITYASPLPSALGATVSPNESQAVSMLSDVIGFNTNAYTLSLNSEKSVIQSANGLPQEVLTYDLKGSLGTVRVRYSFVNNVLNQVYLSDYGGLQSLSQPKTSTVEMAKGFLQRYETFTGNPLYGSLQSTLDKVEPNTNSTQTIGNTRLQASAFGDQTEQDLVWTYVDSNGIPALSKNVVLTYRNGQLESFLDNWQLYTIKGAPTISAKDAISIALQATKNYSYTVDNGNGSTTVIKDFNVKTIFNTTLSYANYFEDTKTFSIRSGDPHILYPSWYVGVGFDQFYSGGVTGLNVRIWADTGNISSIEPIIVMMTPQASDVTTLSNDMPVTTLVLLLFSLIVTSGMSTVYYYSSSKHSTFKRFSKMIFSKRKVSALCLVLLPLTLLVASPLVKATDYKAEIYIPAAGYPSASWIPNEIATAHAVGEAVQGYFSNAGFDSGEYEWSANNYNSAHNSILYNIMWDEYYYSEASMFYLGNGGDGSMSLSENGLQLSYSDITQNTWDDTITFAWMWMCTGAGHYTYSPDNFGFSYAWTQTDLSDAPNGFNYPDNKGHVFLGFKGEAPFISYLSFRWYNQVAYPFIEYFYQAATSGYTVHDALNLASETVFFVPYNQSPLAEGYQAYWPGDDMAEEGWYAGKMVVFGDSNTHIGAGTYQTVSAPSISGTDSGTINTSYQFGFSSTTSDNSNVRYVIFWGDGSDTTITGLYGSGTTQYFSHTYANSWQYTITAYAVSAQGVWSSSSTHDITISGPPVWLTVNAYDVYLGAPVTTAVYVDGNYSGTVGTSPVSLQVSNGDHRVTVDYRAYDMGWDTDATIISVEGDYNGYYNIYSETPVDIYITATYDTTINAIYSIWV